MSASLGPGYFDALYAAADDPWGLEAGWYEQRKRALTVAALPEARYRRGFEPGCANGALSELLAARCDELVCWEPAARPAGVAARRLRPRPGVTVQRAAVPDARPAGRFDLVVVSELLYYLAAADRERFRAAVLNALEPGGTLLAVHWVRPAPEHPVDGRTVHRELDDVAGLATLARHEEEDFVLTVAERAASARSVARRTGLR